MMFKQTLRIAFDFSYLLVLEDWKHLMSALRIYNYIDVIFIELLSLAL
jgi:hypothetical protein